MGFEIGRQTPSMARSFWDAMAWSCGKENCSQKNISDMVAGRKSSIPND
jgi:hypothetical protein